MTTITKTTKKTIDHGDGIGIPTGKQTTGAKAIRADGTAEHTVGARVDDPKEKDSDTEDTMFFMPVPSSATKSTQCTIGSSILTTTRNSRR